MKTQLALNDDYMKRVYKQLMKNSGDEFQELQTTLWEIMTNPSHAGPCKDAEKCLYDQYEEKELFLRSQLQTALADVIVITSFGLDSRPVDFWSDFDAQFSVVTFDDVAKGTDDLYSGQIPKGYTYRTGEHPENQVAKA